MTEPVKRTLDKKDVLHDLRRQADAGEKAKGILALCKHMDKWGAEYSFTETEVMEVK